MFVTDSKREQLRQYHMPVLSVLRIIKSLAFEPRIHLVGNNLVTWSAACRPCTCSKHNFDFMTGFSDDQHRRPLIDREGRPSGCRTGQA